MEAVDDCESAVGETSKAVSSPATNNTPTIPPTNANEPPAPSIDKTPATYEGYYSSHDVANRKFRKKCQDAIKDPSHTVTSNLLCVGLLGLEDYNEANFPRSHVWVKFAEARPADADICRLGALQCRTTTGDPFIVHLHDETLRQQNTGITFVFHHPDYENGHPPDSMLPHKKRNQPTAPRDDTPKGRRRGRPKGSRNKPKGEGASRRSSTKKKKREITGTESPVSEKPTDGAVDGNLRDGTSEALALESSISGQASG